MFAMDVDDLTEATSALTNAENSLAAIADEAAEHAQAQGMRVLPAHLDFDSLVVLDHEQLNVEQVVSAAAMCESKLLYLRRKRFSAASISEVAKEVDLPDGYDAARQSFLEAIEAVDGWISEVEIGFASSGVMHCWSIIAPWADLVESLPHSRASNQNIDVSSQHTEISNDHAEYTANVISTPMSRLSNEEETKLIKEAAEAPQVRVARSRTARETAVRETPGVAALLEEGGADRHIPHIANRAFELLRAEAEQYLQKLEPYQAELVAELASEEEFDAIGTQPARNKFAAKWITKHTENIKMPSWWTDELAKQAHDIKRKKKIDTGHTQGPTTQLDL